MTMRIKLDVLAEAGMAATIKLLPRGVDAYAPGDAVQDAYLLHETLRIVLPHVTYLELLRLFEESRHHD